MPLSESIPSAASGLLCFKGQPTGGSVHTVLFLPDSHLLRHSSWVQSWEQQILCMIILTGSNSQCAFRGGLPSSVSFCVVHRTVSLEQIPSLTHACGALCELANAFSTLWRIDKCKRCLPPPPHIMPPPPPNVQTSGCCFRNFVGPWNWQFHCWLQGISSRRASQSPTA